jgi:hypothetical protein
MKLILTFPTGQVATIDEGDTWQCDDKNVERFLNILNEMEGGQGYLPHPYLEVAKMVAARRNAKLEFEGEPAGEPGAIH